MIDVVPKVNTNVGTKAVFVAAPKHRSLLPLGVRSVENI